VVISDQAEGPTASDELYICLVDVPSGVELIIESGWDRTSGSPMSKLGSADTFGSEDTIMWSEP